MAHSELLGRRGLDFYFIYLFCIGTEDKPQVRSMVFSLCKQACIFTKKERCNDNVPCAETNASDEG